MFLGLSSSSEGFQHLLGRLMKRLAICFVLYRVVLLSDMWCAGPEISDELVKVLRKRLDEATLDIITVMLVRNCKLTPADVEVISPPLLWPSFICDRLVQSPQVFKYRLSRFILFAHPLQRHLWKNWHKSVIKYNSCCISSRLKSFSDFEILWIKACNVVIHLRASWFRSLYWRCFWNITEIHQNQSIWRFGLCFSHVGGQRVCRLRLINGWIIDCGDDFWLLLIVFSSSPQFIQPPGSPATEVMEFCLPQYCVPWVQAVAHYLRQNLLIFLHIPKYTDSNMEHHFKVPLRPLSLGFFFIEMINQRSSVLGSW